MCGAQGLLTGTRDDDDEGDDDEGNDDEGDDDGQGDGEDDRNCW